MIDKGAVTQDNLIRAREAITDAIQAAFEAGCWAVHENYEPYRDPEFGEAASDYAADIDVSALAALNTFPARSEVAHDGLQCFDCHQSYDDPAWIEAVVPHDVWNNHLSPNGGEGGILCIGCMAKRAIAAGLTNIPVKLTAGPFAFPTREAEVINAALEEAAKVADGLANICATAAVHIEPRLTNMEAWDRVRDGAEDIAGAIRALKTELAREATIAALTTTQAAERNAYRRGLDECANIALAIDSGRGNEKEIANAILALAGKR